MTQEDTRTKAMDPHKRTSRFPHFEYVALSKPRRRATVVRSASHIMIDPRIRGRQPAAKVLLALVTYEIVSVHVSTNGNFKGLRTFEPVHFDCQFLHQD
jgi:hypothetical protein